MGFEMLSTSNLIRNKYWIKLSKIRFKVYTNNLKIFENLIIQNVNNNYANYKICYFNKVFCIYWFYFCKIIITKIKNIL